MPHSQRKFRPATNETTYAFVCQNTGELKSYHSMSFAKKAHTLHKKYCVECSQIKGDIEWNDDISSHLHLNIKDGQTTHNLSYNQINTEREKVFHIKTETDKVYKVKVHIKTETE
jgi:hypothetical protein